MKISKFKKYLSWNIISAIGYLSSVITISFIIMYSLAASGLNMRTDIDGYFYDYITKHIIIPYIGFYKGQLLIIAALLIGSFFENKYYVEKEEYGFRIFENHEKGYSILFTTGLFLNLIPLYILCMIFVSWIFKFFGK